MKIFLVIILSIIPAIAYSTEYFIAASGGSDSNNGLTEGAAISTIAHAYTIMDGGDTLTFLDGTYTQQLHPPASLSGSSGAPTIFRAKNKFAVTLAPTSGFGTDEGEGTLYVYSNDAATVSFVSFDGFIVRGFGERYAVSIKSADAALLANMTNHVTLTNIGAIGSCLDHNISVIEIMGAVDTLIEDFFAFGFSRKAFEVYGAVRTTARRGVLRFDWYEGDLSGRPADPRDGMSAYNTTDGLFENILVIDSGPRPAGVSGIDMAGMTISGNDAGGTTIQGTDGVKFLGCLVFNNNPSDGGTFNGITINGGTGTPGSTQDAEIKDTVIWDNNSYGLYVENNIVGVGLSYVTASNNGITGIMVNQSPPSPISGVTIDYNLSIDNGSRGIYYGAETTSFTNNTTARNPNETAVEPTYEPDIDWIPTNTPVSGHARGADLTKRYVDGTKTATNLWPWPNEDIIKSTMCGASNLQTIEDAIELYDSSSITYNPGLCASGKTLTTYIWEAIGNTIPSEIYGDPTPIPGVCGTADGVTVSSPPTTNLCTTGTAGTVTLVGSNYEWECTGLYGGADADPVCSAPYIAPSGSIYLLNLGGTFYSIPAGD